MNYILRKKGKSHNITNKWLLVNENSFTLVLFFTKLHRRCRCKKIKSYNIRLTHPVRTLEQHLVCVPDYLVVHANSVEYHLNENENPIIIPHSAHSKILFKVYFFENI